MRIAILLFSVLLAACSDPGRYLPTFTPHKIDIRQGNLVTQEMRAKIKLGMNEGQVKAALGAPLLNDIYHPNRWDYLYRLEQAGEVSAQQRLTLYFENGRLARIDDATPLQAARAGNGADAPAAAAAAAPAVAEAPSAGVPAQALPPPVPLAPVALVLPAEMDTAQPDPAAEVRQSMLDWAAAWSERDLEVYLASYAPTYAAPGLSRKQWEQQRRQRIRKPRSIAVELSDITIELQGKDRASAAFRQDYRSDVYRDQSRKLLRLQKINNVWLIVGEQSVE
ncbi:MAG: hypothetical protein AUJ80_00315 [Gallionellaceae bacterium CG1_02_60_325]|nr:MAG: hypothetical protein AUJ80_00315 [Gallionellaceae bacterium CG1_02_60_325]